MKIGDTVKIKGSWGFLWEPTLIILEKNGDMLLVESIDAQKDGLLSQMNQTWTSEELLKQKSYEIN
jgi:hypothetical protein